VIPQKSAEFKTIQKTVELTQSTETGTIVEVSNVFAVIDARRNAAYDGYSKNLTNKRLLWHGSRTSNFSGILSQGLRIAPPEAPVSGYLFGKGVYFANSVSKSIMYCNAEIENGVETGLVMLCEVALGKPVQLQNPDSSITFKTLPEGTASTHGIGMMTPNTDSFTTLPTLSQEVVVSSGTLEASKVPGACLHFDEFIVYDARQQTPRFLVELKIMHGS
jgi:poly [ADP-ribose] polymerase